MAFDNGLKNHLFINVPPEDRAPGTLGDATKAAELKENIALYNAALLNHTAAFAVQNPGECFSTQCYSITDSLSRYN